MATQLFDVSAGLQTTHVFGFFLFFVQLEVNKNNKMVDDATRKSLSGIPLLKTKAGPREKELWVQRLKEEFQALIKYVETNKQQDNDWFRLESNKEGTRWFGKCWYIHELLKYEFDVEFDVIIQF